MCRPFQSDFALSLMRSVSLAQNFLRACMSRPRLSRCFVPANLCRVTGQYLIFAAHTMQAKIGSVPARAICSKSSRATRSLPSFSVRSSLTRTMRRESVLSRSSASSAQRSGSCSTRSQKKWSRTVNVPGHFFIHALPPRAKTATQCPVPFPSRFPASS